MISRFCKINAYGWKSVPSFQNPTVSMNTEQWFLSVTKNNEINKPRIEIDVFSNRISARLTQVQIIILKEKIFLTNLAGQPRQAGMNWEMARRCQSNPACKTIKHLQSKPVWAWMRNILFVSNNVTRTSELSVQEKCHQSKCYFYKDKYLAGWHFVTLRGVKFVILS